MNKFSDHTQPRNINPLCKNYDYGEGFYMNMQKFKSIKDFLNKKKKRKKKSNISARLKLLKLAIDFSTDAQTTPIDGPTGGFIGGLTDQYTPMGFNNKMPQELDFGTDHQEEEPHHKITELLDQFLKGFESPLYGLPDGVDGFERDHIKVLTPDYQRYWGTDDNGNLIYENDPYA